MAFNDNWDGIVRNNMQQPKPLNEGHYIELDDFAENIRKTADRTMKASDMKIYLKQVAGSLILAHRQQQDFVDGLIYHLEGIHKKSMSPSKHGNMEIMRDIETVIRELKKYKK